MSNSKSSLTSTVLEAGGVLLDSMSQRPLTVGQALLITFGLFVLAWSIYVGFFLLAVSIGILDDPSETDLKRGHDSYALTPQFVRMYEEWITMLRFEPYEIDGVEKRYAEELARRYGTMRASGKVIVV